MKKKKKNLLKNCSSRFKDAIENLKRSSSKRKTRFRGNFQNQQNAAPSRKLKRKREKNWKAREILEEQNKIEEYFEEIKISDGRGTHQERRDIFFHNLEKENFSKEEIKKLCVDVKSRIYKRVLSGFEYDGKKKNEFDVEIDCSNEVWTELQKELEDLCQETKDVGVFKSSLGLKKKEIIKLYVFYEEDELLWIPWNREIEDKKKSELDQEDLKYLSDSDLEDETNENIVKFKAVVLKCQLKYIEWEERIKIKIYYQKKVKKSEKWRIVSKNKIFK